MLLVFSVTIISNYFDISWFFQGQQNFRATVLRNLIVKLLSVFCVFIFVKSSDDVYIYIAINVGAVLFGNLSLWTSLKNYSVRFRFLLPSKYMMKTSFEMFIPLVAIQVYNVLDKTMLGKISMDMGDSGCYEQTTKIITLCLALITSLTPVIAPKVASDFANSNINEIRSIVSKTFHVIIAISLPICFGIVAISDNFIPLFLGDGFDRVKILLKIYAMVIIIIPLSNAAGGIVLIPMKDHNKVTIAVVIGAITNFVLNLLLIPQSSAVGAAIATVIAEFFVTVVHLYYVRKYIEVGTILKDIFKFGIGSIVMGGCVYAIGFALQNSINGIWIVMMQIMVGFLLYLIYIVKILKDPLIVNFALTKINQLRKKGDRPL